MAPFHEFWKEEKFEIYIIQVVSFMKMTLL